MSITGIGNVAALSGNVSSQSGASALGSNAGADFNSLVNKLMNAEQKNKNSGLSHFNKPNTLAIGVE